MIVHADMTLLANWGAFTPWMMLALVLASFLLIFVILLQRPQGGGLAGAFGSGAGSGQTAFGSRTGDVLTLITIGAFVLFLLAAVLANYAVQPSTAPAAVLTPVTTPVPAGAQPAAPAAPAGGAKPATTPATTTPGGTPPTGTPAAPTNPATPPAGQPATPPATTSTTTPAAPATSGQQPPVAPAAPAAPK